MQPSLYALATIAVATGVLSLVFLERARPSKARLAASLGLALVAVLLPRLLGTRVPEDYLVEEGEALVHHVEGFTGNLAVLERRGVRSLEIDGWWQGEDRPNHQSLAALVPWILHEDPREALVVGIGTGQTPARLLELGITRLEVVDIEPTLFGLLREWFSGDWLSDPRVNVVTDDGRHHVLTGEENYDLVSLELGQLFVPAVAACYTLEFYERVHRALRPGGLVCQFVPLAFLEPETFRQVLATFGEVFRDPLLWANTSELLLIGRRDPLPERRAWVTDARLALLEEGGTPQRIFLEAHGGSLPCLEESGSPMGPTQTLLAMLLSGPDELEGLSGEAAPLRDEYPTLEYAAAGMPREARREPELIELLLEHLSDPSQALGLPLPETTRAGREVLRRRALADMIAEAHLRRAGALRARGDHAGLLELAREILAAHPTSVAGLVLAGDALQAGDRSQEALAAFERATRLHPGDPHARAGIAFALHRAGRPAEALPHYRRALSARPRDAELNNNAGAALAELGRFAEARELFATALRLQPGWVQAESNLARVEELLENR